MRILHTSDWHLGQNFYSKSREAEHQAFLDWLLRPLGVISHVEAMKERIPVQIKVKKINGLGYSKLESTFAVK